MMKTLTRATVFGLLLAGSGAMAADFAPLEDQAAFVARCTAEGAYGCEARWHWAGNAAPIADALLALAPDARGTVAPDLRAPLTAVQWSSATEGRLGDLTVTLPASGRISFGWQKQGAEGRYDLIQALRMRGVTLESLGCPRYPMASMGQEKVMIARAEGRAPFVLAVYGRFAPTGFEYALYDVDADFTGTVPDSAALAAGRYPGGGGRAFTSELTGWTDTCPDPVS